MARRTHPPAILPALLILSLAGAGAYAADDARAITERMLEAQQQRWQGVDRYAVVQTVMGQRTVSLFERMETEDGVVQFRPVPLQTLKQGGTDASAPQADNPAGPAYPIGDDAGFGADFAAHAELRGTETIDGRRVHHLVATDLDQTQTHGGQEVTISEAQLWIDTEHYVPLQMKLSGSATVDGAIRPVTVEQQFGDYREVPDSNMYEPYRRVLRIGGELDPEQRKQLEEAEAQLAQLEEQLAAMPPAQKQMIMSRMGPQLEAMRSMASNGAMEIVTEVTEIRVNPQTLSDLGP